MTVIDIRTGLPVTNTAEREAAQGLAPVAVATRLAVGCTLENGTLRTHRFADHLVLWDLTNAGKRGKKVTKMNLTPKYTMSAAHREAVLEQLSIVLENLQSYGAAASLLGDLAVVYKGTIELSYIEERGVDVCPASFQTLDIKTDRVHITASYDSFWIRDLMDTNNEPTAVPAIKHGKKSIPLFYHWVAANQDRIKTMSYRDVLDAMMAQEIRFHDYCAVD